MGKTCVLGAVLAFTLIVGGVVLEQTNKKTAPSISMMGQYPHTFEKTITKTLGCKYLLFLPQGHEMVRQKWPLILFLHGAGERGDDLELVKKHGIPKIVETDKDFPFVAVSPQCPLDKLWNNEILINLLNHIVGLYEIDPDRIYLTGLSMGGYGTWSLACEFPDRFAAIAPICGGGMPFLAYKLKNVPVWAFHGAKDTTVPLRESQEMVDAIKKCGGEAKLTVYPELSHDCWTVTYNDKELYNWFLNHKRRSLSK